MGSGIGNEGEMKRSKRHFDSQLDRLLTGDEVPELEEGLTDLVTQLQAGTAGRGPDNRLAQTLAAEAANAEGTSVRTKSRPGKPLPTRWRRRIMLSTFLSSLFGKLAIGAVALATTTGGLAATGNLPDPVQDWAAEQLASIGADIPDSTDQADETADDVLEIIGEGDPEDGDEFGHDVADTASDGKSSDGLDSSEDGADNADIADDYTDGSADTADDYTDEVADEAEEGAGNADDYTEEVPDEGEEGAGNADDGDDNAETYRP